MPGLVTNARAPALARVREAAVGVHVAARRVDDGDFHPLHGLVVLGAAADEDPAVVERGAFGRVQEVLGQGRRHVTGVDPVARRGTRGGGVLLVDRVEAVGRDVVVAALWQVDRERPRRRLGVRGGERGREHGERRRQAAVGLHVLARVPVEQGDADRGDTLVVGRRAGEVEVQRLATHDRPGHVEPRVGRSVAGHLGIDGELALVGRRRDQTEVVGGPDLERVASRLQVERRRVAPVVAALGHAGRGDAVPVLGHVGAPGAVEAEVLAGRGVAEPDLDDLDGAVILGGP